MTIKQIEKQLDKHYKVIYAFVNDYCKSPIDKQEFFNALDKIIALQIELEQECNQ